MKSNLSLLWKHVTPSRRKQFGLLLVLMVMASFAEVVSIGAVLPFLAVLTNPEQLYSHELAQPAIKILEIVEPQQLVLPLTIVFSLAALFSGLMRLILLWAQTRLSHAIGADLSYSIYRRTLYQPYSTHVARNSSEVIAGVSQKANEVVYLTILPILVILSSAVMLVAILTALFSIEPTIAISAFLGFGVIYVAIIWFTRETVKKNSHIVSSKQNQVIKALQEGLGGIRDVLIDGTQEAYCKTYRSADLPLRRARANIQIISGSPRFGIEALGMVLIALLAYSLSQIEGQFASTIPVLGALALGAQRLLPALQQAYANWTLIRGGQSQLEDALKLLEQPLTEGMRKLSSAAITFDKDIVIDHLAFRYTPQSPWVLHDVSLRIEKSSRVGFIGSTGSGKSTLIDLVMGLLQPTSGSVKVDGKDISFENQRDWQTHIAHVPQSIFLADTSVAENIAFGVSPENIDMDRVRSAAQKAQISETIESMAKQYNSRVGEQGVSLSGGQRQRIGIARAFYKKADVIVFDEATSALDTETEKSVMDAIDNINEDITVIIIAHRITTLKMCDLVVELCDGEISRCGTYYDIVEKKQ